MKEKINSLIFNPSIFFHSSYIIIIIILTWNKIHNTLFCKSIKMSHVICRLPTWLYWQQLLWSLFFALLWTWMSKKMQLFTMSPYLLILTHISTKSYSLCGHVFIGSIYSVYYKSEWVATGNILITKKALTY